MVSGAGSRTESPASLLRRSSRPLFGLEFLAVAVQAQTPVEAGVVPQPALDELVVEVVFAKDVLIGQKLDVRAVGLVGRSALLLLFEFAALKEHFGTSAVFGRSGQRSEPRVR